MIAVFWNDATFHPVPCFLATILIRDRKVHRRPRKRACRSIGDAGKRLIEVQQRHSAPSRRRSRTTTFDSVPAIMLEKMKRAPAVISALPV